MLATDTKSATLTNRIIHQTCMLTHIATIHSHHATRLSWQVVAEKVFKVLFSDKTNPCRVFLLSSRKACFFCESANFRLFQMPQWEHGFLELFLRKLAEEIGLILAIVHATKHVNSAILITRHSGIMPSRYIVCSQGHGIVQKGLELDFLVAHNIWIWRAPCTVFR